MSELLAAKSEYCFVSVVFLEINLFLFKVSNSFLFIKLEVEPESKRAFTFNSFLKVTVTVGILIDCDNTLTLNKAGVLNLFQSFIILRYSFFAFSSVNSETAGEVFILLIVLSKLTPQVKRFLRS